jgi:hypothetical protein
VTYIRNESFSNEAEPKKIKDYIKCYDILSKDCFKIYNDSLFKQDFGRNEVEYEKVLISENNLGNIQNVREFLFYFFHFPNFIFISNQLVSKCQSEKYGNLKIKIYFEKHNEYLQNLNVSKRNVCIFN